METSVAAAILDRVGKIQVLNNAAQRIVGSPVSELSGAPVWDLPIWGVEGANSLRTAVDAAGGGESVRRKIAVRMADGETGILDLSLTPVPGPNGTVEMLLLEERRTPPNAMQALGISAELADAAAHDLNNLFAGIAGNLELVARGKNLDATVKKRLRRAQRVVFRGNILTDLMDSIGVEQKPKEAVEIEEAVMSAIENCRSGLGSEIDVKTRFETGLWHCRADRQHLLAALRHLIVRVYDVGPGNDGIFIVAANTVWNGVGKRRTSCLSPGDYIRVSWLIRNAAPEKDRRSGPVGARPERSMGFGLRLVRAFARQSGGDLVVGDSEDPGVFASLYLPRAVEQK